MSRVNECQRESCRHLQFRHSADGCEVSGCSCARFVVHFTKRELDIIKLCAQGKSTKEISLELHMRPGTIRVHLDHVFKKTNLHNKASLMLACLRAGVVSIKDLPTALCEILPGQRFEGAEARVQ